MIPPKESITSNVHHDSANIVRLQNMSEIVSTSCAIVIVNYGSHRLIERNFSGLDTQTDELNIVVVDNYSTAAERAGIRELCSQRQWTLVESETNLGFGRGVNLGVEQAESLRPQTIVLLNPDAVISQNALNSLVDLVREDKDRLVCPRIESTTGAVFFAGALLDMESGRTLGAYSARRRHDGKYQEWFTGACLAFSPELWNRIGGFDHDYFLYWEDVDFSFRAVRSGARLHFASDIRVTHDEGGTQKTASTRTKSPLYYYYNIRNRMLFARKWLSPAGRRRWCLWSIPVAWEVIMRGGRRQLLQSFTPWKSLFWGLLDGWRDSRGARKS